MLLVQDYLKTHSFGELAAEHGVYASFSKSGHKWSLNYDQIEAKESNPLAQECRGLVLSCKNGTSFLSQAQTVNGKLSYDHIVPGETEILAFPMKRFFNHGQSTAADINWHDPKLAVLEKLDGTLCIVYWDKFTNLWCVATRSVPEADIVMDNGIFTFRTLFEKAVLDTSKGLPFDQFTSFLDKDTTYCFELTTPYNRIVVFYPECGVTLLAARKTSSLKEIELSKLESVMGMMSIPVVKAYTYSTVDELVSWVSTLNPMEHEGVVVRDSDFNRIKVKNAAYVAYNKVRDALGTSERNCIEIILLEKDDDVIPFLPEEIVNNLLKIKVGLQSALKAHDEAYMAAKAEADAIMPGDKKTFAILVTKDKKLWHAPFFQMFDGKAKNMKEFIFKNCKDGSWGNSFLDKLLELSKIPQA
jgi:hypothetical protein